MKWFTDKYDSLKNAKPVISRCGDDCAVCPRYLAETDEQLHETAVFWQKAGWRETVVSNEDISCTGCGSKGVCAFGLLDCTKQHGVESCKQCAECSASAHNLISINSSIAASTGAAYFSPPKSHCSCCMSNSLISGSLKYFL